MEKASLKTNEFGSEPDRPGYFVVNAKESVWHYSDLGSYCAFEGDKAHFSQFGVNLHVLEPNQPNAMYHSEANQEDFLVLKGECTLVIEGEEIPLSEWDFVHCPPQTEHVFIGRGDRPCVLLMVGTRSKNPDFNYPASDTAAKYRASVKQTTSNPIEAYKGYDRPQPGIYKQQLD